tara:strand:- start:2098 stop:2535 length:438 start_codon:yes stop_codon:yes gene_type:complete
MAALQAALDELSSIQTTGELLISGIYESEPVDCPPESPRFLNAVVEIRTELSPQELLAFTQRIEEQLGRPGSRELNAPRCIDLDLLYFDELSMTEPDLTIPHPGMFERAFVVLPLSEIRPDLCSEKEIKVIEGQNIERLDDISLH